MKDALGHGSDARGLSGGNVTPQAAASAMQSDHVVGGAHDSTYHGYIPSRPAGPGGDKVNTSDPREYNSSGHKWGSPEALADFKREHGGPRDHAAEQRGFNSGKREINRLKKQGK